MSRRPIHSLVPALLLLYVAQSGADDYASAVDAAAALIDQERRAAEPALPEEDAQTSREEFETFLQERYPGSYVFYMKLLDSDKAEALVEFNTSHSISKTRRLIMDRFLKR